MAQQLTRITSSSRYVVNLLVRAPEMVQMLASSESLGLRLCELFSRSISRDVRRASDKAAAMTSVRALHRSELYRITLADVLGAVDIAAMGLALSGLAEATLDAALELARRETEAPPVGVIGMGRWSGYGLGYASDIGAMFTIPDGSGSEEQVAAIGLAHLACDLIGNPGPDPVVVVDTNLYPEGEGRPLVRTVSSYLTYYAKQSSVWEAQALLRTHPAAGEQELASTALGRSDRLRYPDKDLITTQVAGIRWLKSRMEAERIPRGTDKERHLKLGSDGPSDVEWAMRLLQLQYAGTRPALRTSSTLQAIDMAGGLESPTTKQATDLREGWLYISRVYNAVMLVRGRLGGVLPIDYRKQSAAIKLVGYGPGQRSRLIDDTIRVMRRTSGVVSRVFWNEVPEG